jgi:predicted metalloprotease with PDZ domain
MRKLSSGQAWLALGVLAFAPSLACGARNASPSPAPAVAKPAAASSSAPPVESPRERARLAYVIRFVPGGPSLAIDLTFRGDDSGTTAIDLPSHWAGEKDYFTGVRGLTAEGARIVDTGDPSRKQVVHAKGATVHLRYEIIPTGVDGHSEGQDQPYRPLLTATFFHFIGHGVFITPADHDDLTRPIDIRWEGVARDQPIANSFATLPTCATQCAQSFDANAPDLRQAIYVGGDFRTRKVDIEGRPVWVAMRGEWKFTDEDFATLVEKVMRSQRGFWNDFDVPYFLVTLIKLGDACCSYGGTGLTHSFATFVATDRAIDPFMHHLLSHELFHTWNGGRIQPKSPEELVYWFSEGFTNYFARRLNVRAGIIDADEAITDYNEVLFDYWKSKVREAPNERVMKDFWSDSEVNHLPYQRGDVLAHEWDARMRAQGQGHSLDDVMRDLMRASTRDGTLASAESIDLLVRAYLPSGISDDVHKYIDQGTLLEPSDGALGPCMKLVQTKKTLMVRGFDRQKSVASGVVTGTVAGSNAERAGLKDGQIILESVFTMDPAQKTRLRVRDAGSDPKSDGRWIEYFPAGDTLTVPQYERDAAAWAADTREATDASGATRCTASL